MQHDLFVIPDYRHANPYQRLMYDHVDGCFKVQFGQIEQALTTLVNSSFERRVLLHLHWEDALYRMAKDEAAAFDEAQAFLDQLERFVGQGGMLLWTVHNKVPHEDRYPAVQRELRAKLSILADCVHVHGPAAARWMVEQGGVAHDKIAVIAHGNYCSWYRLPTCSVRDSRRTYGIGESDRVFLFFGRIDRYKGGRELVQAFGALTDCDCRLIVAGFQVDPVDEVVATLPEAVRKRIIQLPEFIDDAQVAQLFHAADFVVMPYRSIMTSGTLFVALSLARPVIVPDLDELLEIARDGHNAIVYDHGLSTGLEGALRRASALPEEAVRAMGWTALSVARGYDWLFSGLCLSGLLHRLVAIARPKRRLV